MSFSRQNNLPKSVSPSLKSLAAAILPVKPWAFLLPHWPKLLNCCVFCSLDGLTPPERRFPTWLTCDEGFPNWLFEGAAMNSVKPFWAWNTRLAADPQYCNIAVLQCNIAILFSSIAKVLQYFFKTKVLNYCNTFSFRKVLQYFLNKK